MARPERKEWVVTDWTKFEKDLDDGFLDPSEILEKVRGLRARVEVLEGAQKIRNWHEAPKHNGPILAVTRIRWVDEHEMWSAIGCKGEFVHDDADGWIPLLIDQDEEANP